MSAALLVLLGLSAPPRAPDLQVEATTSAGVALPELADAVARALVASGARVVLRGPGSGSCVYCAQVVIVESGQGTCRVEVKEEARQDVKQEPRSTSATLHFPAGSPLFDRARAIAIQARLLATSRANPETRSKDAVARSSARRSERKTENPPPMPPTPASTVALAPIKLPEFLPAPQPEAAPARAPAPTPARREESTLVAPITYVDRDGAKPVNRAESKKSEPARAKSRPAPEVAAAEVESKATPKAEPDLGPRKSRWPWAPTLLGAGAAVAAGICAVVARDRYNALSDKAQPYQTAHATKLEGQRWQTASLVLSGVAVAGLVTGAVGFVTRSSEGSSLSLVGAPVPGGAMVALAGDFR